MYLGFDAKARFTDEYELRGTITRHSRRLDHTQRLDTIRRVQRLVAFYVHEHNSVIPHSAFKGQTPDEIYFGTGNVVPIELEKAKERARMERLEANRALSCSRCT